MRRNKVRFDCSKPVNEITTIEDLEELAWNNFLATKRKTTRRTYSLHRRCKDCRQPIVDNNLYGYCKKCEPERLTKIIRSTYAKSRRSLPESNGHLELKRIASVFLGNLGCINIRYEYKIGLKRSNVEIDVCGELDNKLIAVECGGSTRKKLLKTEKYASKIFILPYGKTEPYQWDDTTIVCHCCGHIVGDLSPDNHVV
jgi:hypothetical protein